MSSMLNSRKFWLAVVGVGQTLLFHFLPDFPDAIWQSVNILIAVLIAGIAIEDAWMKAGGGRHKD